MTGHWWLYGRKRLSPLCQKGNYVPPKQKGPKKFEIFQATSYKTRKKILSLHKRNICLLYTMENKNTNTDYQKVVRIGDQQWYCSNYIWNHFLFGIRIHYLLHREFSSSTWKKSPHLKCQFPPKITIWHKSLHIHVLKNGSTPPPPLPPHYPGVVRTM